jgi:hypothetical protein
MSTSENHKNTDGSRAVKKKVTEGKEEFLNSLPPDLGLDADHSSDNENPDGKYNNDNDMTSPRSKGGGDADNLSEPFDSSPIMNK